MEFTHSRIIRYRKPDAEFKIFAVADQHFTNRAVSWDVIHRDIALIKNDPYAIWLEVGDYCLPMNAEALTKRGFIKGYDLKKDDVVLSYHDGKTYWVPIIKKIVNKDSEFINLSSKSFDVTCTPNHAWLTKDNHKTRPQFNIVKKVAADKLKKHQRILVSAECGDNLNESMLTNNEVYLLGWIVTDGCLRKANKSSFNANIVQSKKKYYNEIKQKLSQYITSEYHRKESDCVTFYLSTQKLKDIFKKININPLALKENLPQIVTRLNKSNRETILDVMIKAEGWVETGHNGHTRIRFSQKQGSVLEAFKILATLHGYRIGKDIISKSGVVTCQLSNADMVYVSALKKKNVVRGDSWCVQTKYGNFICRVNNQITITGNSDWHLPSHPYFDAEAFDQGFPVNQLTKYAAYVSKLITDLYLPIATKCLGWAYGNHDHNYFIRHNQMDVHEAICEKLDVPNLRYAGWMYVYFIQDDEAPVKPQMTFSLQPPKKYDAAIRIYAFHGKGAASTPGGKMNALRDVVNTVVNSDLIVTAHLHEQLMKPFMRISPDENCCKPVAYTTMALITGTYLRNYQPDHTSYGEKKAYPVTTLGATLARYKPSDNSMVVEIRADNVGLKGNR